MTEADFSTTNELRQRECVISQLWKHDLMELMTFDFQSVVVQQWRVLCVRVTITINYYLLSETIFSKIKPRPNSNAGEETYVVLYRELSITAPVPLLLGFEYENE